MEKTKNKGKKIVLLVCGIVLALAVIAGGVVAALFMNNGSASGNVEYSGEVQIQDEVTLRAALKSKGKCEIVLTDDIVITKELEVFGDKKLSGGSIIMDMRREGSNESVLAIQKGATLVLNGTTVDGNSVVNCISIKAGGELDSQSGSLLYGYPYGLDVSGKVTITDILIDEALHTGVNVAIFGEVDMLGGTISHNVYGIAVAEEGSMDVADGVVMTKSAASFIVNYGKMKIVGGKYDGANDNAIENWGTMDIRGTAEKPIEICNGRKSAINAKNNAKLTAEHINIHDMAWHGMCVEKNTTATLKNISYDTTGKSTLYVNSAKVTAENITILNGTAYGVYGTKSADVTMTNVTIKNMGHRAVVNELSVLTADGLVIENSVQHGVYTTGDSAVTIVNNATITGTERSAFAVAKGKGTITNSHIADTKRECVSVAQPGTVIVESCTIDNAGNFGVATYGGVANVKNTTITNSKNASVLAQDNGTVNGENLTIKNSAKQAIRAEKGGIAKVTGCNIDTTGAASVYANGAKIVLKSAVIVNSKTYGVAAKDCSKANGHMIQLNNVTVSNPGEHGIGSLNGYLVAENIKVTGSKRCGVYSEGDKAIINMANVEVYKAGSCGLGFKGAAEITARNVTIDSPKNEGVFALKGANVKKLDNITINDPGTHGVSIEGEATVNITVDTKYNPENTKGNGVTVLNPGKNGIRVKGATLTAKNVTVKNAGGQGISANTESKVSVDGCTIDTTKQAAVYAGESKLTLKNATIDNAGSYAVAARDCVKEKEQVLQLTDVEINKPALHGVGSLNGYVVATNVKVTQPKRCGIYTEGVDSIFNMANIEVIEPGTSGFGLKGAAEITARNVTIENAGEHGIYVEKDTVAKKLDNITIKNPAKNGVYVNGNATVNFTVDKEYNPDNTTGNGLTIIDPGTKGLRCDKGTVSATGVTIKNAGEQGIFAKTEANVTVNGCSIDTTKQAAVYAEGATLKLKNATIDNAGSYGVAAKNCSKEKDQVLQLTNVEINKPGEHGVGSLNGYVVAANVKVTQPKRCGIYTEGVDSIFNMANVEVVKPGTSGVALKGAAEITARNVAIEDAAEHGIYVEKDTTAQKLDNITIKNPTMNGVYVNGNATVNFTADTNYNPDNTTGNGLTIINPGTKGLRCDKGTVSATGVTIKNAGEQGIFAKTEANVTVNGCSIDTTKQAAVYAEGATLKLKNAIIDNAGSYGVAAKNCSKEKNQVVQLTNVEINKPGERGIGSLNGYVVADSIKVTQPKGCGIYSEGADAIINMANIEVIKAGSCGFGFAGAAEITARNVTITDAKNEGILVKDNANVKRLDNVVITNPGSFGLDVQSGSARITADTSYNPDNTQNVGMTIENATKHGIVIRTGATLSADGTTIKNSGERGIHHYGVLTLVNSGVTIDETVGHGVYMSADANITGSGLTIKNVGDNGIFSEGGSIDITGLTVENTKNQGVQVKGGDVKISDFSMKETGGVAMRVRNSANVTLADGTIYAYNHGIYADGTSETATSNVTVERSGKNGEYTTNPLVYLAGSAKVELGDATMLDGKDMEGNGVNVTASGATFVVNGAGFTGNTTDVVLAKNATIKLQSALSGAISVQPGEFKEGAVIVEKLGDISDVDFVASMGYIVPVDTDWTVNNKGKLAKPGDAVASIGETTYTTLEAAIEDAADADTIKLLRNLTVSATIQISKNVNIVADTAVTITANDSQTGSIFYVTGGNLNITGATENAKITVASGVKTTNIVYNNGGNVVLTNVALAGNVNSTAANNSTYGIYNNAGNVTAKSVTIKDIAKGDGINIRAGASADLDNVSISNCGRYGLKTYGTVNVYNTVHADKALCISNTTDHAVDLDNGGKLISNFANVPAGTYAITIDTTTKSSARGILVRAGAELDVTDVSVLNAKSCGVELLAATSVASITNASIGSETYAIQTVASSTLTVSNVTVEKCGETAVNIKGNLNGEITMNHNIVHVDAVDASYDKDGNIEYWYCTVCNTVWKDAALTQVITMAQTVIPKLEGAVASIGDVKYASLEAAVDAANASEGADTIKLLNDVVEVSALVTITSDITITADKAVTIQAVEGMKSSVIYVTGGTLTITGASQNAKITIAASTKTQSLVKLSGGNANITNVVLLGNAASTATDKTVYGIYNEAGKVTATNVVIKDITKGDGINIRSGASADLNNVTIDGTSRYGLKTYGTVNVYNALSISNTTEHGIDIDNGGKVISHFENVAAGTYAVTIDTATANNARGILVRAGGELNITDVSIKNVKNNGVELLGATSVASITNATIAAEGYGINAAANSSLTLGNVTATGNPAGMNLAKDAKIALTKALTQNITVQLAEYAEGIVVAEKSGEISDADFAASMALLIPVDTNWVVAGTGLLGKSVCEHSWSEQITTQPTCTEAGVKTHTCSKCGNSYTEPVVATGHTVNHVAFVAPSLEAAGNKEYWYCSVCNTYWNDAAQTEVITDLASVTLPQVAAGNVAYMNGEAFQTLEAAIAKANEAAVADTIYLLSNVTVAAQIAPTTDMTIAATKAVTITINSSLNAYPFTVASGKTLTVEGVGSGRITVASTSTAKEVFYNQGTLNLTNVSVSGGKYAVNNRADTLNLTNVTITGTADNGIHLAGGTTTVTSVTISNTKGHGIGCYANLELQPAVSGGVALTIDTTGTSSAKKHGIYASYNASITGSGLSIQNATNAGFFGDYDTSKSTVGVTVELTNVTVKNTGAQGIQAKKGIVTISDFTITGTGSAALRPYDSKGNVTFNLSNGTVTTGTYGLAMDKSTHSVVLNNVVFERTGTKTEAVLSVTNSATLTATNVTVNIPSAFTALSINGASSYEGITVKEQNG